MNSIRRWRLKNQLRVAARRHAAGELAEMSYAVLATHVVFELAGRVLRPGDSFSPTDFELAVPRALGLPTAYQWDASHLLGRYGPYHRAPTSLDRGTYDTKTGTVVKNPTAPVAWGVDDHGLFEAALPLVQPLPRFEAWAAKVRKDYPTLTGLGLWVASLIVAGAIGAWIAGWFDPPAAAK